MGSDWLLSADILVNVKWQFTVAFLFINMQRAAGDSQAWGALE